MEGSNSNSLAQTESKKDEFEDEITLAQSNNELAEYENEFMNSLAQVDSYSRSHSRSKSKHHYHS